MTTPGANGSEGPDFAAQSPTGEEPQVVVRDRRRIDPETGQVRPETEPEPGTAPAGQPAGGQSTGRHAAAEEPAETAATAEPGDAAAAELRELLDERTADLQRLTAEYANYRKRMDRDRETVAVNAKAVLATDLLSVLDDIERAAAHGDLTGAFKSVADKLSATLQKAGLAAFGHEGEEFDPAVHEAVQHDTSPDVSGPTVTAVLRRGYRFGERTVRPALVAVTDHEPGAAADEGEPAEQSADQH